MSLMGGADCSRYLIRACRIVCVLLIVKCTYVPSDLNKITVNLTVSCTVRFGRPWSKLILQGSLQLPNSARTTYGLGRAMPEYTRHHPSARWALFRTRQFHKAAWEASLSRCSSIWKLQCQRTRSTPWTSARITKAVNNPFTSYWPASGKAGHCGDWGRLHERKLVDFSSFDHSDSSQPQRSVEAWKRRRKKKGANFERQEPKNSRNHAEQCFVGTSFIPREAGGNCAAGNKEKRKRKNKLLSIHSFF